MICIVVLKNPLQLHGTYLIEKYFPHHDLLGSHGPVMTQNAGDYGRTDQHQGHEAFKAE
jgi:hypothetical protein